MPPFCYTGPCTIIITRVSKIEHTQQCFYWMKHQLVNVTINFAFHFFLLKTLVFNNHKFQSVYRTWHALFSRPDYKLMLSFIEAISTSIWIYIIYRFLIDIIEKFQNIRQWTWTCHWRRIRKPKKWSRSKLFCDMIDMSVQSLLYISCKFL